MRRPEEETALTSQMRSRRLGRGTAFGALEFANNAQFFDGYTPFFLIFGAEAVLPTDVRYNAPRVVAYVEEDADKVLADAQDLLDEARDVALV
jgi:hypothetical protein